MHIYMGVSPEGEEVDKVYRLNKNDNVVFLNKKAMRKFVLLNKKQKQLSLITGSILSVFAVMAIFNEKIVQQNQLLSMQQTHDLGRNVASVGSISNDSYHKAFQAKVMHDLKQSIKEDKVLFAVSPTKADSYLKGTLKGSYTLNEVSKNQFTIQYLSGEKANASNMNAFLFEFMQKMFQGDFRGIEKVSSNDAATVFSVIGDSGELSQIEISHSKNKEVQSIRVY